MLSHSSLPLSAYADESMRTIRTDSQGKFRALPEQSFSSFQVKQMLEKSGLSNILIRHGMSCWYAVRARKVNH